ncbi:MAG: hypothetical protein DRJ15_01630 [Bacteroidetes bacterium]|nr:MAG: hypothetical protein DRJ15_01630 [Bacteroidota bacterium]
MSLNPKSTIKEKRMKFIMVVWIALFLSGCCMTGEQSVRYVKSDKRISLEVCGECRDLPKVLEATK